MEVVVGILGVIICVWFVVDGRNDMRRNEELKELIKRQNETDLRAKRAETVAAKKKKEYVVTFEKQYEEKLAKYHVPNILSAQIKSDKLKADSKVEYELALSNLKSHLPFDPSTKTLSTELVQHDKKMWDGVMQLIKKKDSQKTSLYFVKIKSLLDDREYFKIGTTTESAKTAFKKSIELELIDVISVFDTEKWKAAFLEYHFLRAFRLYDGQSNSIGEQNPETHVSGYTEVVRSNSVNKITEYFEELDFYNKMK
jgi:hypothetical protein|tara:strand:+ start:402 stop:1166 length:765 start_codon:yes stop_codon:yes gene_type:complete